VYSKGEILLNCGYLYEVDNKITKNSFQINTSNSTERNYHLFYFRKAESHADIKDLIV